MTEFVLQLRVIRVIWLFELFTTKVTDIVGCAHASHLPRAHSILVANCHPTVHVHPRCCCCSNISSGKYFRLQTFCYSILSLDSLMETVGNCIALHCISIQVSNCDAKWSQTIFHRLHNGDFLNFMRAKEKNAGIYSIQVCPIRSPFSSIEAYSACTSHVLGQYESALNVCCMCIVKYADIHWSISLRFHRSYHFEWNTWYSITWSLLCFSLFVIHLNHLTRTNTCMRWLFLLTSIPTMFT